MEVSPVNQWDHLLQDSGCVGLVVLLQNESGAEQTPPDDDGEESELVDMTESPQ